MYSEQLKITLGNLIIDYIVKLNQTFYSKIKHKLGSDPISVGDSEILIKEYINPGELVIDYKKIVLHEFLSGVEYKISGSYKMRVMKDIGEGGAKNIGIEINFTNAKVKYSTEIEEFSIEGDIPINYIIEGF